MWTLSWCLTRLQVLYITSLATNYTQITKSLREQGTRKSQLALKMYVTFSQLTADKIISHKWIGYVTYFVSYSKEFEFVVIIFGV